MVIWAETVSVWYTLPKWPVRHHSMGMCTFIVLYALDEGLQGWNVLQSVAIDWLILLRICSLRSVHQLSQCAQQSASHIKLHQSTTVTCRRDTLRVTSVSRVLIESAPFQKLVTTTTTHTAQFQHQLQNSRRDRQHCPVCAYLPMCLTPNAIPCAYTHVFMYLC